MVGRRFVLTVTLPHFNNPRDKYCLLASNAASLGGLCVANRISTDANHNNRFENLGAQRKCLIRIVSSATSSRVPSS
jgi:hypothetical protein